MSRFKGVAPMFLVDDVERTAEWYRDCLGFEVGEYLRSDHGPEAGEENHPAKGEALFVILERDGQRLMLGRTEAPGRGVVSNVDAKDYACDVYFWVADVTGLFAAVEARVGEVLESLTERPYGLTEFRLRDCDGRALTFGGPPSPR